MWHVLAFDSAFTPQHRRHSFGHLQDTRIVFSSSHARNLKRSPQKDVCRLCRLQQLAITGNDRRSLHGSNRLAGLTQLNLIGTSVATPGCWRDVDTC